MTDATTDAPTYPEYLFEIRLHPDFASLIAPGGRKLVRAHYWNTGGDLIKFYLKDENGVTRPVYAIQQHAVLGIERIPASPPAAFAEHLEGLYLNMKACGSVWTERLQDLLAEWNKS